MAQQAVGYEDCDIPLESGRRPALPRSSMALNANSLGKRERGE